MSYLINNNNIGKENVIFNNSVSNQSIDSTVVDITGSSITYTPIENCNNVIYEFKAQYTYRPDNNSSYFFELFESTDGGSNWSGLGNNYCIEGAAIDSQKINNLISIKFILPYYTGSRSYKLRGRTLTNSYEIELHVDSVSSEAYYPTVIMYSIL